VIAEKLTNEYIHKWSNQLLESRLLQQSVVEWPMGTFTTVLLLHPKSKALPKMPCSFIQ